MSQPTIRRDLPPTSRDALERAQEHKLLDLLRKVFASNAFYRKKLEDAGFDPGGIREGDGPQAILERLPFTTKAELEADQEAHPPFGSNLTFHLERYTRIHQTSGTTGRRLWWLDTPESWDWFLHVWEEIYAAAGVSRRDRLFFPFSFGPFIGFWAAFDAAARVGCLAIPGGGMTTGARLRVLIDSGATVVLATPTYALHLAEAARAEGLDLAASPVRALIVAGEPGGSIPATRERIESAWGARCLDHFGLTEAGPVGLECSEAPGGMHVIESEFLVEVVEPLDGSRAAGGEGELVVTNLGRAGSPVIRYRTGDLVRWSRFHCPCGRPYGRLEGGILSRIDDMVFIRGNNVYPSAVEGIIRRFPEVAEFRVHARQSGEMASLKVEVEPVRESAGLAARVAAAVERELLFRADVVAVPPGSLPRFELKGKRFFIERADKVRKE